MKKSILLLTLSIFFSIDFYAQSQKIVLVEEGTGMWCQYCPRGEVYAQTLHDAYPDNSLFIAIHVNDVLENQEYADACGLEGLPNGNVDRAFVSQLEPFTVQSDVTTQLNLGAPADIGVETTFDANTRDITMTVTGSFTQNLNGDYRLAAIVVENGITGPAPAFDQSNSYSGGGLGPMGEYTELPNPVPASIMVYNHVGRHLAGGYNGDENSLPSSISSGETHSYTYEWTLPEDYNEEYVYVVGVLINASNGRVENAGRSLYLPGYANAKPFFHSDPKTLGFVGSDYQYDVVSHDPDFDDITMTLEDGPAWLNIEITNNGFATLSGTPTETGTFPVTIKITDGESDVEQQYEIEVTESSADWVQVGLPGLSIVAADYTDIDFDSDGNPIVLISNGGNDQLYVYKYVNDAWEQQGGNLAGEAFHTGMAVGPDNSVYVISGNFVNRLVDGNWQQLGGSVSPAGAIYGDIIVTPDGTPYVAVFPFGGNAAYMYDGNSWVNVGPFTDAHAVWNRMTLNNEGQPMILYGTDGQNIAYSEVVAWDGSDWNLLGDYYVEPNSQTYFDHDVAVGPNGEVYAALTIGLGEQALNVYQLVDDVWELHTENISGGATQSCGIEVDNDGNIYVGFRDETESAKVSVMKYDGADWSYVGLAGFTNIADNVSLGLDKNGVPYVAYSDEGFGSKLSVKKFEDLTVNSFNPVFEQNNLTVFPNPNKGTFTLEYESGESYEVYDNQGKLIQFGLLPDNSTNTHTIQLDDIPNGIYMIKVIGSDKVGSTKFMKTK